ncbi:1,4-beta-xylanase [Enterococcus sp. JM4C]|uniref:glycoside hydrolase family 113 n=1 Tax=Candidatus Enterococcus huntleyi TaxID=1857217 RepID=UPI00137B01DF|nr:1,4-beta-xylanase [Enterococcus sp. JM4C]KAF1296416.1 1,4-beta-xylanase [Enterococcus sp. JM4C]
MDYVKGITFGFMSKRGEWATEEARESLRLMKEGCGADHVILPIVAEQDTAQSIEINWRRETVLSDEEVVGMIDYAKEIGLKVILKPMVNVSDGTWRAHINFFDHDVPCEPKWHEWFASYTEYLMHYAAIAQRTACEIFVIGCELVNTDRRENEWRMLIKEVRTAYQGAITYNCDKYQESNVTWWDAVDVISSSGYYPIDKWEQELDRIEAVVLKEKKPFFFCEAGCPSRAGSEYLPNDWSMAGEINQESQAAWYAAMFSACEKRNWVEGFGLWDWKATLYKKDQAKFDDDYALYNKLSEGIVKNYYENIE